jgi:hypothetical protein
MGFTLRLVAQTICVWTDGRTQTDMLTDDGAEPAVERNVLRFGRIDGTVYCDQVSMSEG